MRDDECARTGEKARLFDMAREAGGQRKGAHRTNVSAIRSE
jgi:hypothetical protein